ncbi:MAG: alkaline phosphatase [Acidobacteria bacterium]|nr:alkaline phosphatase [Acidobacteriota bacterium]
MTIVTTAIVALIVATGIAIVWMRQQAGPTHGNLLTIGAPVARPPLLQRVDTPHAKNLILVVGDGMGLTQLAAARFALRGPDGILWIQALPSTALVRTQSSSSLVTDSAAAATAIATGVRVANGVVSVDPAGASLPTLFERARARGLSAGLVTTARITDATPAAFSAHVASRDDELEIAKQQAASGIEVLLGCNPEKFLPPSRGGERKDGADLAAALRAAGYATTLDPAALSASSSGRLFGLFAEKNRPPLPALTRAALDTIASDPEGFVLLVESEETDSASHNHQLERLIRGMNELDEAVRVALEFAKADGNTLVVVTADHETGGMQLVESKTERTLGVRWSTGKHTGQPVPLYAWGPGSARFDGEIDNTEVHDLLTAALGLDGLSMDP